MVDRVSVALALIGSSHAPVCNLEPLRSNTLIERDLAEGAVLVISSQLTRPGRFNKLSQPSSNGASHSRLLHHHLPRTKSPQTTMRQLEAEAERRHLASPPPPPAVFAEPRSPSSRSKARRDPPEVQPALPPPAPSQPQQPPQPPSVTVVHPVPRHSHRRSLSTSEHLHFALKGGPPTLSAAAFEPDDHLLSTTDSNSSSPKSVSHDEEDDGLRPVDDDHKVDEEEDDDEDGNSSSSSDNGSVIKTTVYADDDSLAADTPKSVFFVDGNGSGSGGGGEDEFVDTPKSVIRVPVHHVEDELDLKTAQPKTPQLNAAAMILKRRHSFTASSSVLSPKQRPGGSDTAPSLIDLMAGGGETADEEEVFPIRKSDSKDSIDTAASTSSSRRTRNSHRRHHSRQLSQPTLAGGGVEICADATNTANEAVGNAEDKTDLVLPDGLIVTSQGITSSPSPSEKSKRRNHGGMRVDTFSSHSPSKLSQPTPRLLAPGHFHPDELETLGLIGKGTAGVVTKALHVSALRIVAVKSVQKFDFTKRETTIAEIRALHRKMVPFLESGWTEDPEESSCIVGFYDAYIPKGGASVNLVLEWMDGGSLQDLVDRKSQLGELLSEDFISVACRRMLKGLVELQESRLLHRDMKPANVLVSKNGAIKLSDFGVSIAFGLGDLSNAQTYIGSLSYMAPERVNASKQGENGGYSYASDLWAVGLIAYVCATGDYPFKKQFDDEGFWGLYQAVEDDIPPLSLEKYSQPLVDFISKCLQKNPEDRPTAQELLEHDPFVQILPNAVEAVAEQFEPVDQALARQEFAKLLSIVCEAHEKQYLADASYEAPVFTLNRFRVLCHQLRLQFASDSAEEQQLLDELNDRLQRVCGGGGGGRDSSSSSGGGGGGGGEEEEQLPRSPHRKDSSGESSANAAWKKSLTLELQ